MNLKEWLEYNLLGKDEIHLFLDDEDREMIEQIKQLQEENEELLKNKCKGVT